MVYAWYIRPIRFENSIRNRIGRPILFEIRFERKKNDSQIPSWRPYKQPLYFLLISHTVKQQTSNVYHRLGAMPKLCPTLPNFHRGQKYKIWSQFLTPVTSEVPWFQTEPTHLKSRTCIRSIDELPKMIRNFAPASLNFYRGKTVKVGLWDPPVSQVSNIFEI